MRFKQNFYHFLQIRLSSFEILKMDECNYSKELGYLTATFNSLLF